MSSEAVEPTIVSATVVCATQGCVNVGIPITLDVPEDVAAYVCGACSQRIDDVVVRSHD
jgi:hypothetical protein